MPSWKHESLVQLFRNSPDLAAELLQEVAHVALPLHKSVSANSAELTTVEPPEYRADLVLLLDDPNPVFGIVLEVQLAQKADKKYSWPAYGAVLRARHRCPCAVLVVAPDKAVARWAREPIDLGPVGVCTPVVIGPEEVPVITDEQVARRHPEAAVLSAMAHGSGEVETAIKVTMTALAACADLEDNRRVLYSDVVLAALSAAARKAFEMLPEGYEFQAPVLKKAQEQGIDQGQLRMAAEDVLEVLEVRGLAITDEQRERVRASQNLDELRTWHRRAVTAETVDSIFVTKPEQP